MDFIFADDSEQNKPQREEMEPLIGLGGIHIPAEQIADIEHEINELCSRYGFPDGEEFKCLPVEILICVRILKKKYESIFIMNFLKYHQHIRQLL